MNDVHEVVVTGMGVVSSIGNSLSEFENALYKNKSGVGLISRFPVDGMPTQIGAEVKSFESKFRDIKIDFALQAAKEAMLDAFGRDVASPYQRSRVSLGIGLELFSVEDLCSLHLNNFESVSNSLFFLNTPSDFCAHLISNEHQFFQSPLIHIGACASGCDAIGHAYNKIRSGHSEMVLAGGTDSMINPMGIAGFCKVGAMSKKNALPQEASMPFNKSRDGFVIGEGAAFLVLEAKSRAVLRGARIYAQISGYGSSLDAYSPSDPHPEGLGAILCMRAALESAGLDASKIHAISSHGTGTPRNDPVEAHAIRTVFKDLWEDIPVFATKSLIGHTISAAGAIETVASVLAIKNQMVHSTLNLTPDQVDDDCLLHHVYEKNLEVEIKHLLKNSFGFGGQNASLVVSRVQSVDAVF